MQTIVEIINGIFDWLFQSLVSPFFAGIGQGLEWLVLRPLDYLHFPVAVQIVVVAVLTGLLSLLIRGLVGTEEKEKAFGKVFSGKKTEQQNIDFHPDWKTRDVLYRTTDQDIDEDFNTYLAQRFARHTAVYLLPIFLTLFWLNNVLPTEELLKRVGGLYVISLPANSYGIEGLSVTFVFLASYILALIFLFQARKLHRTDGSAIFRFQSKTV